TTWLITRRHCTSAPFPYTTLFRSAQLQAVAVEVPEGAGVGEGAVGGVLGEPLRLRQPGPGGLGAGGEAERGRLAGPGQRDAAARSEEHTSELQSRENLVCRLLLEK